MVKGERNDTTCPVCKGKAKLLFPGKVLLDRHCNVFSCGICGVVFLEKGFQEGEVSRDDPYWRWKEQEEAYRGKDIETEFEREFTSHLEHVEGLIKGRKLLDIGCGSGIFLTIAKRRGWGCFGVDISPKAVTLARERLNVPIELGTIETGAFLDETFDLVTMWDVIEHVQDPAATVREAWKRLRGGGLLVIKTPDENFLPRRINKALYRAAFGLSGFMTKYFYYQDHLFYFSRASLLSLLKNVGAHEVVSVRHAQTGRSFLKKKLTSTFSGRPGLFHKMIPGLMRCVSPLGIGNKLILCVRKV